MHTEPLVIAAAVDATVSRTTMEDLHPDVLTHTLRLLDGPSLFAVCSANSHLRFISTQSDLWYNLCLSTWPSLRHPRLLPHLSASPLSFFSNAFPFPASHANAVPVAENDLPCELISAVDIYHRGVLIFSRVVETETSSPWFRGSPFRIDASEPKTEPQFPTVMISPEELIMNWILFDPAQGQAVNVSSRRPVDLDRHWYTGETIVRFAAAAASGGRVMSAAITCCEWTGQVRMAVLTADDVDGACVNGEEGLQVVRAAMDAGRRWRGREAEEEDVRERYLDYLSRKRRRKENRARREGALDLCCTAVGVSLFLAFLALIIFR